MTNLKRSSDLYSGPSFWRGTSRLADLFGYYDLYNYSETETEADVKALRKDWHVVGSDILSAIDTYLASVGANGREANQGS